MDPFQRYAYPEFRERIGAAEVEYLELGIPDYHADTLTNTRKRRDRKSRKRH
jgi:hypothetical protein